MASQTTEKAKHWLVGALHEVIRFFQGFFETIKNADFLKLAGATFLVFNGFQMIGAFQSYVVIYYVYGGDKDAAGVLMGLFGTISAIVTLVVIALTTVLSTRLGKRETFFVMIGISVVGYLLKWFCYNPDAPYLILLTAFWIPFGLGALFTLMPSMVADVCDKDELTTGLRREGMYGSIFWWVVKLGMSLALLFGGMLLDYTGFDVELDVQSEHTLTMLRLLDAVVPAALSVLAIALVARFTITERAALQIRQELERRRGAV